MGKKIISFETAWGQRMLEQFLRVVCLQEDIRWRSCVHCIIIYNMAYASHRHIYEDTCKKKKIQPRM